ncbi:MAG: hypothetical protein ABIN83_01455, partial [Sphingomicrobium sp.]
MAASIAFFGSDSSGAAGPRRSKILAITHISILPMDRNRSLSDQTVIVDDERIIEIGSSLTVRIPPGSKVVDGRGMWLTPGLADLHTHVHDAATLAMMPRLGVTTILDMGGGGADFYKLRDLIREGGAAGPNILTALKIDGPGDEGSTAIVPSCEAEARAAVRRARDEQYDFVKVYSRLSPPIFHAIADEARKQRIAVIGHAVRSVSLANSFQAGQIMLAHAEEFLAGFGDSAPDRSAIPALVALTRKHGVTVTANLDGIQRIAAQWGKPDVTAQYVLDGRKANVPTSQLQGWLKASYSRLGGTYDAEAGFVTQLVTAL